MIIAGIGCRRNCPAEAIVAIVEAAGGNVTALAAPLAKCTEPGLQQAARQLGLPLLPVSPETLADMQPHCVTRSLRVLAEMGVASVAEGCALGAAGPGARLILPRISNSHATCALAEGDDL